MDSQSTRKIGKKLNEKDKEHGGQDGPDPTRYGDWEKGGDVLIFNRFSLA